MRNWQPLLIVGLIILGIASFQLLTSSITESKEDLNFENEFHSNYKIYALNQPEKADFAGENIPLDLIDVREKLDRELLVNTYWQSQTILFIKRTHRWFPTIEKILAEEGVPDDFKYLALIESGLEQTVSPAGATGVWQLMKDAGKEFGLEINTEVDERYNIEKSTKAACLYLKSAHEKFASWTLAAASYNMGMTGVSNQLTRQKATNYFDLVLNDETSRYLYRIMAAKIILSDPVKFGFQFRPQDLYPELKYHEIIVTHEITDLATFAFQNGINYKALKYLNPWLRDTHLANNINKEYAIKIPSEPLASWLVHDKEQVTTFTRENSNEKENKGDENGGE
jgi:membrane-bound lytic murein transglycosylase D